MITQFSPGEWRCANLERTTPTVVSGSRLIAEVHDRCVPIQHAEDVANARLIAAAPRLFAALARILKANGALDAGFECECDEVTPCQLCEGIHAIALANVGEL